MKVHLTPELIDEGRLLLQRLDEAGVVFDVALWVYADEDRTWRLHLAHPTAYSAGLLDLYDRIREALFAGNGCRELRLDDIEVRDSHEPFIRSVSKVLATHPGMSGVRLALTTFGRFTVDEAYIYRARAAA